MKDGKSKVTGLKAKSMMNQARTAESAITSLKVKRSPLGPTNVPDSPKLKAKSGKLS